MTFESVLQLKRQENKAREAYYSIHGKVSVAEAKPFYDAMVKATKARQKAMTAYAGTQKIKVTKGGLCGN